jgi:nucleotide-binding universal stress UspA family protein
MSKGPAFTRILCAVDFSLGTAATFDVACELATRHQAALTIMHVVSAPFASTVNDAEERFSTLVSQESVDGLADCKQKALASGVAEVDTVHVTGTPLERIVAQAEAGQHQLIVIGTHGRGRVARALLGSVAERVVRHATCSVLTVKPPVAG